MKYKVIFLMIIFINVSLSSQNTWIETYQPFGSEGNHVVNDILVCSDGYVVNGRYSNYDPEFGDDFWGFLVKTDFDGDFLWAKKDTISWINEPESSAIIQTSDNGFLSAVYSLWGGSALIKRDSNGNREWVTNCGDFFIHSMSNSLDGNVVLSGRMYGLPAIRKINQETEVIWTQYYSYNTNTDGSLRSIYSTSDNGYCATGYITNSNTRSIDVFVLKTNEYGDSVWTRTFDGYGLIDGGAAIIENSLGGFLISGSFRLGVSFIAFVAEFSSEGDSLWLDEYDADTGIGGASLIELINDGYILYATNISKLNYDHEIEWTNPLPGYPTKGCKKIDSGYICARRLSINLHDSIGIIKTDEVGNYTDINNSTVIPSDKILQCYPNPFNPLTTISFSVDSPSKFSLSIYNIKGQKIKNCGEDFFIKGNYKFIWDGTNQNGESCNSGCYFIQLKSDQKSIVKKCLLLK